MYNNPYGGLGMNLNMVSFHFVLSHVLLSLGLDRPLFFFTFNVVSYPKLPTRPLDQNVHRFALVIDFEFFPSFVTAKCLQLHTAESSTANASNLPTSQRINVPDRCRTRTFNDEPNVCTNGPAGWIVKLWSAWSNV